MDDTQAMLLELYGKGYSCAQIVMIGGLRLMGRENPDLTRAMGGLAMGVGGSGEVCGALAGAVCLLSLHTGKGLDHEYPHPDHALIMDELVEWFRAEIRAGGAITCEAILDAPDRVMSGQLCGRLISSAWTRALELLSNYGIDPCLGLPQS
ncbi:MAG: C-GCAxxG-C-C family protein [Desulfovibrio sp.]|jgi:C_GCAxxG_C_C family probable redox protein|nr:C-GCAxxG-C-C family protein [Desulfovibrio sp.]